LKPGSEVTRADFIGAVEGAVHAELTLLLLGPSCNVEMAEWGSRLVERL
jgi:hypothetical protein